MITIGNRSWQRGVGIGLLALASPLLLGMAWVVLVDFPWDVILGLRGMMSGRDVVQVADGEETDVTLFLLLLPVCGACWLSGLRPTLKVAVMGAFYGAILTVPIIAVLGIGAEYGLQALLARHGYAYCTFHVTSRSRGEHGTYVYVRDGLAEHQGEAAKDAARIAHLEGRERALAEENERLRAELAAARHELADADDAGRALRDEVDSLERKAHERQQEAGPVPAAGL